MFDSNDPGITNRPSSASNSSLASAGINVTASPNPFSDRIRFNVESNISGKGSSVVYNRVGQRVKTVFEAYVSSGRRQVLEFSVPPINRENLICIFTVNGIQRTGKLINQRYLVIT